MINLYTFQLGRVELVELEELEELEEYAGAGRNDSTILLWVTQSDCHWTIPSAESHAAAAAEINF